MTLYFFYLVSAPCQTVLIENAQILLNFCSEYFCNVINIWTSNRDFVKYFNKIVPSGLNPTGRKLLRREFRRLKFDDINLTLKSKSLRFGLYLPLAPFAQTHHTQRDRSLRFNPIHSHTLPTMLILTIIIVKWKCDERISDRVTLDSSKSDMGYGQSVSQRQKP